MPTEIFKLYKDIAKLTTGRAFFNKHAVGSSPTNAPLAVPHSGNTVSINVTKDFKWTKTLKAGREDIPSLRLTEFYVNRPAFVSNINRYADFAKDTLAITESIIQDNRVINPLDLLSGAVNIGQAGTEAFQQSLDKIYSGTPNEIASGKHLKAIENLYGVQKTQFSYYLPYLETQWKDIGTTWGDDRPTSRIVNSGVAQTANTILQTLNTGVGMDFARTYNYPQEGSTRTIKFFLDNTQDSHMDGGQISSWQQNWQLIFLLLYQNLPNRLNVAILEPPVIYRALLPGVFYYRYSYISSIEVKSLGNKKVRNIQLTIDDNPVSHQTLIPEAFEVALTLRSLLPDSKNEFFESLENKSVAINIV